MKSTNQRQSVIPPPKKAAAKPVWSSKIAEAIKAREAAKEARRGKPVGFPKSLKTR